MKKVQTVVARAMAKQIDEYARLKMQIEEMDAKHERLMKPRREKLAKLFAELESTYTKEELRGAKTDLATTYIQEKTVPNIKDWEAFLNYLFRNRMKAADLLRKQVSSTAYNARLEAGKSVPGLEPLKLETLTIRLKRSKA